MNTQLTTIELPQGKAAVQKLERKLVDLILNGEVDPLQVEVGLKGIEEAIKAVRTDASVRHLIMQEAGKYPEKTFEVYGCQITKKLTPARYDYENTGDPVWNGLNEKITDLTKLLKAREKMLASLTGPIADPEEGVVIHPPAKTQGETLAIKFV